MSGGAIEVADLTIEAEGGETIGSQVADTSVGKTAVEKLEKGASSVVSDALRTTETASEKVPGLGTVTKGIRTKVYEPVVEDIKSGVKKYKDNVTKFNKWISGPTQIEIDGAAAQKSLQNLTPNDSLQVYRNIREQLVADTSNDELSKKLDKILQGAGEYHDTLDPVMKEDIQNIARLSKANPAFKNSLLSKVVESGEIDSIPPIEEDINKLYLKGRVGKVLKKAVEKKPEFWSNRMGDDADVLKATNEFRDNHMHSLYNGIIDSKDLTVGEKHRLFKSLVDKINNPELGEQELDDFLKQESNIHGVSNEQMRKLFQPIQRKIEELKQLKDVAAFGAEKEYMDTLSPVSIDSSTETEIRKFSDTLEKLKLPENRAKILSQLDEPTKNLFDEKPEGDLEAGNFDIKSERVGRAKKHIRDLKEKVSKLYPDNPEQVKRVADDLKTMYDKYNVGNFVLDDFMLESNKLVGELPLTVAPDIVNVPEYIPYTEKLPSTDISKAVENIKSKIKSKELATKLENIKPEEAESVLKNTTDEQINMRKKVKDEISELKIEEKINPSAELKTELKEKSDELSVLKNDIEELQKLSKTYQDEGKKLAEQLEESNKKFVKDFTQTIKDTPDVSQREMLWKQLPLKQEELLPRDFYDEYISEYGKKKLSTPIKTMEVEPQQIESPPPQPAQLPSLIQPSTVAPQEAMAEEGLLVKPSDEPPSIDPESLTGTAQDEGMIGEPKEGEGEGDFNTEEKKGFFTSDGFKQAMGTLFGTITGSGIAVGLTAGIEKLKAGDFSDIKKAYDGFQKFSKTLGELEKDFKKYRDIWNGSGTDKERAENAKKEMERIKNEMARVKQMESKAAGDFKRAIGKANSDIKRAQMNASKKALADKEFKSKNAKANVEKGILKDTSQPSIKIYNNFQSPESFLTRKSEDDFSNTKKINTNSKNKSDSHDNVEKAKNKSRITHVTKEEETPEEDLE